MSFQVNPIKQKKDQIREEYKMKRRELSQDEKMLRDEAICKAAQNLVSFRYAKYVLLYAPADDEINIYPIAKAALEKGKKILFPRCNIKERSMKYHFVEDISQLSPDSYGICEPPGDFPFYDKKVHTGEAICFVPGLVYDRCGYRLGYGKGYYDRYLSSFKGCRIGVVYSDFIVPTVPRGRYDIKVDIMLTEKNARIPSEG